MIIGIANIALVVHDYDDAIAFYTEKLSFKLIEDTALAQKKRWVQLESPGRMGSKLLLVKATTPEQSSVVGKQAGGRVFLFMYTDNFDADYTFLTARGVVFSEGPRTEKYGKVGVFSDLYGNRIDLIEPIAAR